MKKFMCDKFLLNNKTAENLWQKVKDLPIIDYHCHINPKEIAEDKKYKNITEVWLYGDHYKWRAMRACGIDEKNITGSGSDYDKFASYAEILPSVIGNPLYHWSHLELKEYFGIEKTLSVKTAKSIWNKCNDKLSDFGVRDIVKQSNVELICTTDDPDDNLEHHIKIKGDKDFTTKVLPTFRPDRLINNADKNTVSHLEKRLNFFVENGCRLSDHGILNFEGDISVLLEVAKLYKERNITMQLHFGVNRNANSKMFKQLGADTGFDCIGNSGDLSNLAKFLDLLDKEDKLPRTILYSINPNDNAVLATIASCFKDVSHGSAWWFNDTKIGMEQHLTTLSSIGVLGKFIGMLTDSRSFLSYTRHEYFRRILCNFIGDLVEKGEFPDDEEVLEKLVKDICYYNSKELFKC